MQNDNIYKKLRCIFLVLAIISMIIALTKKVHAETLSPYYNDYIDDIFLEYINNTNNQNVIEAYNNGKTLGYFCILKGKSTNQTYDYTAIIFSDIRSFVFNGSRWSSHHASIHIQNIGTFSSSNNCNASMFILRNNSGIEYVVKNTYTFDSHVEGNYIHTGTTTTQTLLGTSNNLNIFDTQDFTNTFLSNGDFKIYCFVYSNGSYYKINSTFLDDLTVYNNTNGFSVFKYNNLGIDTLRIVPPKNKVTVGSHTSNISSVTFDLVIDDTIIPTTYNSESDYYYESIEYNRAYYEIPFTTLLPSSINDFNNVYVTNVVYNNTWENQGGESGTDTFYYVDNVYLKQTIDNNDIGQVSITHIDTNTGYDETHITDIYNMITNASTISGEFNTEKNLVGGSSTPYSFTSFQDAIVKTVECYHPTGTKSSDWTPVINENGIEFISGDNMYWLEYNDNSQVFNNRYNYNISPYSYIRENNYTGYYDILYFIVHEQLYTSNGTGFSTLSNSYTRYFYFISDRYYNKLILYREMDIMEYIKLNNEISEKVYNYLYERLLNIDDNLYYYIKDKANIDNDILNALENIDNDMQFNFDILNDLLNKILAALSDLNLTQLDTIETKLNTIIANIGQSNNQNEDDTVAEAIQYYKSHNTNGIPTGQVYIDDKMSIWISGKVHLWLQGTDANTDKTNLINSVFDTLTSIYDSMKNNNDIFPNIQYYLDAIAKNNNYAYETHGDYMTRLFKGNVDISTYSGITE